MTNLEDLAALRTEYKRKSQDVNFRKAVLDKSVAALEDHRDSLKEKVKGTQENQFLKIETKVVVGPTTPGDQPAAMTFDVAFPNACDAVFVMFGDQDANALASGYECGGISITAVTKTGFTCTFRWTATPASAANIYFTVFAIGR